jgi:hypothetical protein
MDRNFEILGLLIRSPKLKVIWDQKFARCILIVHLINHNRHELTHQI